MTWPPAPSMCRRQPGITCCRGGTGDMAIAPLDAPPATRDHQLQGQHRLHGHRPGAFLVRSPPPLDHRRPSPATRSTCCRGCTGDMAIGPGRSWCVRRGPSMHSPATRSTYSRQPGIPAAGAAPVTWPPARGVPGAFAGAPRCTRRQPGSTCCRGSTGDMATGPDVPGEHPGAPRCAASRRRRQPEITSCRGSKPEAQKIPPVNV